MNREHRRAQTRCLPVAWLAVLLLLVIGCGGAAEPLPTPSPTLEPMLTLGDQVFTDHCAICHALTPDTVVRGPSLAGIASRAATRSPDLDARGYLYNAIMRPDDFIVDGFENLMPTTLAKELTGEQLDAVVAYLLTFE